MAYVAISKNLIDQVKYKLDHMANAEKNTLVAPITAFDNIGKDAITALMLDVLWAPEADLRERLEKYGKQKSVNVKLFTIAEDGTSVAFSHQVAIEKIPCIVNADYFTTPTLEFNVAEHEIFSDFAQHWSTWRECISRWTKVKAHVVSFIEKCKSANEAVKLWPDVVKYFDKDIIERLESKPERAKATESIAAQALASIDMDALKSSEVLARMAGAK